MDDEIPVVVTMRVDSASCGHAEDETFEFDMPRDNSEPMEEYVPGTCPDCGSAISHAPEANAADAVGQRRARIGQRSSGCAAQYPSDSRRGRCGSCGRLGGSRRRGAPMHRSNAVLRLPSRRRTVALLSNFGEPFRRSQGEYKKHNFGFAIRGADAERPSGEGWHG